MPERPVRRHEVLSAGTSRRTGPTVHDPGDSRIGRVAPATCAWRSGWLRSEARVVQGLRRRYRRRAEAGCKVDASSATGRRCTRCSTRAMADDPTARRECIERRCIGVSAGLADLRAATLLGARARRHDGPRCSNSRSDAPSRIRGETVPTPKAQMNWLLAVAAARGTATIRTISRRRCEGTRRPRRERHRAACSMSQLGTDFRLGPNSRRWCALMQTVSARPVRRRGAASDWTMAERSARSWCPSMANAGPGRAARSSSRADAIRDARAGSANGSSSNEPTQSGADLLIRPGPAACLMKQELSRQ